MKFDVSDYFVSFNTPYNPVLLMVPKYGNVNNVNYCTVNILKALFSQSLTFQNAWKYISLFFKCINLDFILKFDSILYLFDQCLKTIITAS